MHRLASGTSCLRARGIVLVSLAMPLTSATVFALAGVLIVVHLIFIYTVFVYACSAAICAPTHISIDVMIEL